MELRVLKSKRVLMGFTQEELAIEIGIHTKSYNLKENGRQKFSIEEVTKVSEALKLNLDEVNQIFLGIKLPKRKYKRRN